MIISDSSATISALTLTHNVHFQLFFLNINTIYFFQLPVAVIELLLTFKYKKFQSTFLVFVCLSHLRTVAWKICEKGVRGAAEQ